MALTEQEKRDIAEKERRLNTPLSERVSVTSGSVAPGVRSDVKEHITRVPAKWTPGFKHTKEGWCVVESRRQMNRYAKEKGLEWT